MPGFSLIRGTSTRLAELNPIVQQGLQIFEVDTGRVKIGDGVTRWEDLEYFLPESGVMAAIQEAIANLDVGTGGTGGPAVDHHDIDDAMMLHINHTRPHPIYDDGPSLLLLYQNAKV